MSKTISQAPHLVEKQRPDGQNPTQRHALIVIDVQNEYFEGGSFPQWQALAVAERIAQAIQQAEQNGWSIIAVQHIAADDSATLFNPKGQGIAFHPSVVALLQGKPLVVKQQADAFLNTELEALLRASHVSHIHLCGMMTQNCITHTALSPQARPWCVHIQANCCTAPTELIHKIALRALGGRHQID